MNALDLAAKEGVGDRRCRPRSIARLSRAPRN
jgi:hypothetical protein